MLLAKEDENLYDKNAMVVKMPELNEIHEKYHNEIVKPAKGKDLLQTVKCNAGKVIGRVPANLCKIFNELIIDSEVHKITCLTIADAYSVLP